MDILTQANSQNKVEIGQQRTMDAKIVKIELNLQQIQNHRNNTKSQMTRELNNDLVPKGLKESCSVQTKSKFTGNDHKKAMSSLKTNYDLLTSSKTFLVQKINKSSPLSQVNSRQEIKDSIMNLADFDQNLNCNKENQEQNQQFQIDRQQFKSYYSGKIQKQTLKTLKSKLVMPTNLEQGRNNSVSVSNNGGKGLESASSLDNKNNHRHMTQSVTTNKDSTRSISLTHNDQKINSKFMDNFEMGTSFKKIVVTPKNGKQVMKLKSAGANTKRKFSLRVQSLNSEDNSDKVEQMKIQCNNFLTKNLQSLTRSKPNHLSQKKLRLELILKKKLQCNRLQNLRQSKMTGYQQQFQTSDNIKRDENVQQNEKQSSKTAIVKDEDLADKSHSKSMSTSTPPKLKPRISNSTMTSSGQVSQLSSQVETQNYSETGSDSGISKLSSSLTELRIGNQAQQQPKTTIQTTINNREYADAKRLQVLIKQINDNKPITDCKSKLEALCKNNGSNQKLQQIALCVYYIHKSKQGQAFLGKLVDALRNESQNQLDGADLLDQLFKSGSNLKELINKPDTNFQQFLDQVDELYKAEQPLQQTSSGVIQKIQITKIIRRETTALNPQIRSEQRTEQILREAKNKYYLRREHLYEANSILQPAAPPKRQDFYLKEANKNKSGYTLVLDLDETLVHFVAKDKKFKLRPGCIQFLKDMSQFYEIVIFTAAVKDYADFILNYIDKTTPEKTKNYISHRLYRDHCELDDGVYVKDLSKIGRDPCKTIIVDNIRDNFERQPENGIEILTWLSDPADRELYKLGMFLQSLVQNQVADVRESVKAYTQEKWRNLSPSKRHSVKNLVKASPLKNRINSYLSLGKNDDNLVVNKENSDNLKTSQSGHKNLFNVQVRKSSDFLKNERFHHHREFETNFSPLKQNKKHERYSGTPSRSPDSYDRYKVQEAATRRTDFSASSSLTRGHGQPQHIPISQMLTPTKTSTKTSLINFGSDSPVVSSLAVSKSSTSCNSSRKILLRSNSKTNNFSSFQANQPIQATQKICLPDYTTPTAQGVMELDDQKRFKQ